MSKFDIFGDIPISREPGIMKAVVFISDIINVIAEMPITSTFIIEHDGRETACRVIIPNQFFTFKEFSLMHTQMTSSITDMKRKCDDDKQCVFEDREGDKWPIVAVRVVKNTAVLVTSNTMIVSHDAF